MDTRKTDRKERAKGRAESVAAKAFVGALASAATLWLWTTLVAIANFAFRYPAFDQFRLYPDYLGRPFPDSAIQVENGHRPILPALVRLAEIHWFSADQTLQIVVGAGAALLALALIVATVMREHEIPALTRVAACALAVMALFWLGNARMLMHGNELVHTYFVVLFAVLGVLAVDAARRHRSTLWMSLAGASCLAATFSFGTGMASFGAVLVLGVILRLRARDMAIPAVLLAAAVAVYLLGLPGSGGVRGALQFDPTSNLATLARWLSAPWMRAWLGLAEPPIESWLQSSLLSTRLGHALVTSARWLSAPFGVEAARQIGLIVGGAGVAAFLSIALHAWRAGKQLGTMRVLALGLSIFALGAAVIVCFARLRSFELSPNQVFADRYLPWSCLFWLGLALYTGGGAKPRSALRPTGLAVAAALTMLILAPSHRAMAGWSATVSRHIQQSAVAAQLGIWDAKRFPDNDDARREHVDASLSLLRQRRLSVFAEPAFRLVELGWQAPGEIPAPLGGSYAHVVREFEDPQGHRHVADFEGWMPRIEDASRDAVLVVVDRSGTPRGLAKTSFIGPHKKSLRFNVAYKHGFDGYVLDVEAGEQLFVLVLDASSTRVLASIALQMPDRAP